MSDTYLLHKAFLKIRENKNTSEIYLFQELGMNYLSSAKIIMDKLVEIGLLFRMEGKTFVSKSFVCGWCKNADVTEEEYTYDVRDYGGICTDFKKPICIDCMETVLVYDSFSRE